MQYAKVDPESGMFLEDALMESIPLLETGEPDPSYIETPCHPGFFWPRWNFETQQWEEGGSAPEPTTREPTEMEVLKEKIEMQDMVIEEILFTIIPEMLGGGL